MQNVEISWCVANLYACLASAGNNAVLSSTLEGLFVHVVNISAVLFLQEVEKQLLDKGNLIILRGFLTV